MAGHVAHRARTNLMHGWLCIVHSMSSACLGMLLTRDMVGHAAHKGRIDALAIIIRTLSSIQ